MGSGAWLGTLTHESALCICREAAAATRASQDTREDTKDECITVRATVRGPVWGHRNAREVSGRAVARSEHLGEARVSTVHTDTASVRTASRV